MMKCHDIKMHRDKLWPRLNVSSKILGNEMSKTKGQASIKKSHSGSSFGLNHFRFAWQLVYIFKWEGHPVSCRLGVANESERFQNGKPPFTMLFLFLFFSMCSSLFWLLDLFLEEKPVIRYGINECLVVSYVLVCPGKSQLITCCR